MEISRVSRNGWQVEWSFSISCVLPHKRKKRGKAITTLGVLANTSLSLDINLGRYPKVAIVQRLAIRWALGCVNPPPGARGSQEAGFTQPRVHLVAHLCITSKKLIIDHILQMIITVPSLIHLLLPLAVMMLNRLTHNGPSYFSRHQQK